ncbi:MAG: alkaline serine protease [Litorilinea sp.]|nr:MAG: alkaline serine protease [Litorilinea sp.]
MPGIWVEIRGTLLPDSTVLASRIRMDEYEAGEVVVRLQPDAISSTVANRYGLVARSTLLADAHIYLLASPDDENEVSLVDLLRQDPDVVWAELNYVNSVPESEGYKTWGWGDRSDEYINQYAFEQVGLPAVSAYYTGTGILVAVLDTGVDLQHPALVDRLQLPGLDVVSGDTVPQDEGPPPGGAPGLAWGHGTHVAGIVARLAPGSRILPVRVLDANGRGNTFLLAYAIEWAVDQGADVINLSLGTPYNSQVLQEAIQAAIDRGVVVVAAAGNSNTDTPQYPAAYADVLAVTAVDGANRKASFANYGWVDLAAPGVGITSTVIGPEGHGYGSWSGTSMAAPFVSGGAALVRTKLAQPSAAPGGRAGVLAVAGRLRESARPLDAYDAQYGDKLGGLLDLEAALLEQEPVPLELRLFIPWIQR